MKFESLLTLKYMPRWVIVLMDLLLVFFGVIMSFLLRFNFRTENIEYHFFMPGIVLTLGMYSLSFILTGSYKELIRHTTLHDTAKLLYTSLIAAFLLLAVNIGWAMGHNGAHILPNSVILINFFASFFLLAGIRICIKGVFGLAVNIDREPVIIFGAGSMGQAAFKAMAHDVKSKWKVVAFMDDNRTITGKNLFGVPVINFRELARQPEKYPARRLIFAIKNINIERRNKIASFFVDKGIKVSYLTAASKWLDGSLKSEDVKDIRIEDLLERAPIQTHNSRISFALKGKRILITGAAGSIGSEIVRQVTRFEPELILLCDIAESPLHAIGLELAEDTERKIPYRLFIGNITDVKRMRYLFDRYSPEIVFHAAAYKHVPMMESHPQEAILNNVWGTRVVADLSVEHGVERFVMISTDKAVNPTNIMGASKRLAEMYIQGLNDYHQKHSSIAGIKASPTLFITTRFGNVLGSNGSVIPRFKAQLEKGGPITVTHPDITRYFMTIPEACQLVLEAGVMGNGGEIYVFDMGKSVRVADLAKKMITLAGLKPDVDIKIVYTGLRPGEKLYEELLSSVESTLPTHHEKIKIAKVRYSDYHLVSVALDQLVLAARKGNDWECVEQMKVIIPEFISNNSRYEKLDQARREGTLPAATNPPNNGSK